MAMKEHCFTIHDYSGTNQRSSYSEGQLFTQAQRIIHSATQASGWSWGVYTDNGEKSNRNAFVYNKSPPSISSNLRTKDKLWGSQFSEDEVCSLEELDEFLVSTKSHREFSLVTSALLPSRELPGPVKRPRPFDEQPSSKRRKVDFESIFRIIPQPHIHPSPYLPSLSDPKGRPFCKTTPSFIPPYTDFSMNSDDRLAWLIPIRGAFPWLHCSTGQLVDSDFPMQALFVESSPVIWTKSILLGFWDYLLSLRRNAPVGALGIAFHPVRVPKAVSGSSSDNPKNDGDPRPKMTATSYLSATPSDSTLSRPKGRQSDNQPLLDIDYIKIYHAASCSFYVRSALDIWVYHPSNNGDTAVHAEPHLKIRPLRGARLPLVDDISRGVLVS
ncbi:hypothetical protein CPB83DRAFT_892566 [Crepidotus variabilis]|uniref:Uncharacterized protein n=1 Tax=Crepidotus variabilis TaxID=179855 RepID=A0A9P6EJ29_9AGAR|nr:hypothetical protein CPB83DRAFT_892566 [Crepidotus variabilis]